MVAEHGWARLDAFKQQLAVYSNRASRAQWVGWGGDMDLGLMRDFVAMIADGRAPSITGQDGLRARGGAGGLSISERWGADPIGSA